MRDDTPLLGLKNIGPTIAARFKAVGIETVGDLRVVGPAEAYIRVKASHPDVTISVCNYLYSLQGALDGVHWDALPSRMKEQLLLDAGVTRQTKGSRRRAKARGLGVSG